MEKGSAVLSFKFRNGWQGSREDGAVNIETDFQFPYQEKPAGRVARRNRN